MHFRVLAHSRAFHICVLAIILGGAAEVTMSQWASAFLDRESFLRKQVGDIVGVCGFVCFLASGRSLYGLYGGKFPMHNTMVALEVPALFPLMACMVHILVKSHRTITLDG